MRCFSVVLTSFSLPLRKLGFVQCHHNIMGFVIGKEMAIPMQDKVGHLTAVYRPIASQQDPLMTGAKLYLDLTQRLRDDAAESDSLSSQHIAHRR